MSVATRITFAGVTNLPLTNRSVLFTPASYGANLRAWFAADKGVTVAGGRVTAMQGLGPASGLSLVGLNGGMTYVASAQNGLPGINGVGTNADATEIQSLSFSTNQNTFYSPLNFNYNQPFTVSLAVTASPSIGNNFIVGQGYQGGFGWAIGYRGGQFALYLFGAGGYGTNWLCLHSGFAPVSGTAYSLEMIYTGATGTASDVTFYVNGVATTGATVEANGTLSGGTQLSSSGYPFAINPPGQFGQADQTTVLELAIAAQAASPAQAMALEKYLNSRWALHS